MELVAVLFWGLFPFFFCFFFLCFFQLCSCCLFSSFLFCLIQRGGGFGGWRGSRSGRCFSVNLIIRFFFYPTSWVSPKDKFSDLIIYKDEEAVWEGTEPPAGL